MRGSSRNLGPSLDTSSALFEYLTPHIKGARRDELHVLCLNNRGRLLRHVHFLWSNETEGTFRRVVTIVTDTRATAGIVLAQSHVGRTPRPSIKERTLRKELTRTMRAMGLHLHDHVIAGATRLWSFQAHRSFRL